jgi:hypothetical protein
MYINKVDIKDAIEQPAGYRLTGADFDLLEVIKTLRLGEIAVFVQGGTKNVKASINELYPKFDNNLESDERLEEVLNPDLDEGEKMKFHREILGISKAVTNSISIIKNGIRDRVKDKLIQLVSNKSQLQNEIPWMLNSLEEEGFITKTGE